MKPPFIQEPRQPRRDRFGGFGWLRRDLLAWLRSPAFHHVLLAGLHNALTGIGVLCLLALALVYWQGKSAVREFAPEFMQTAARFTRQVLREDVVSALAVKLQAKEGLTVDQVSKAMQARAKQLGLKLVARYPLSKHLPVAKGQTPRYMEVFEFCDPAVAAALVNYNPDYLVHIPCRIALYEDAVGSLWLAAMNLDLLIHGSKHLPEEVKSRALAIQDGLLKVMAAGAGGAE